MRNHLLDPIYGITLYDYASVCSKVAEGFDKEKLIENINCELKKFNEAEKIWSNRIQDDDTFELITAFGKYFANANFHPKLKYCSDKKFDISNENLDRLISNRFFFEELNAAIIASNEFNLNGFDWVFNNYGINSNDFQYANHFWEQNNLLDSVDCQLKYEKYKAKMIDKFKFCFKNNHFFDKINEIDF